jgi:hypothetical protein
MLMLILLRRMMPMILFCSVLSAALGEDQREPLHVSVIQLIANPEKYDQKQVAVIGFMRLEPEGDALYLSREDFMHGITANAIWIDVTPDIQKNAQILNNNYVALLGVFDASGHGHAGMFSGRLTKISRAAKWSDSHSPRRP